MKRCPFCNAELQENASFCLYCMRPLECKENITPKRPINIKLILILILTVAILISVLLIVLLVQPDKNDSEAQTQIRDKQTKKLKEKEETTQTSRDPETEKENDPAYSDFNSGGRSEILAVYEDFKILASVTSHQTDCGDIFNPNDFLWTHTVTDEDGDTWEIYTTDCALEDVVIRVAFCEGDLEIVTTICNLTEDNYEDGLKIAEACIFAAYNCSYVEIKDALRNDTIYPRKEITYEESLFGEGLLPEPVPYRIDDDTQMTIRYTYTGMETTSKTETHYMVMEQREREYKGKTYFDLAFLHTFE
ncbi:MAG: hypothetical protein E7652_00365 [Ruminococcaceae bacterium]|nr:hypothetical protein [Oscillospiraceae bacterium]